MLAQSPACLFPVFPVPVWPYEQEREELLKGERKERRREKGKVVGASTPLQYSLYLFFILVCSRGATQRKIALVSSSYLSIERCVHAVEAKLREQFSGRGGVTEKKKGERKEEEG